MKYLTVDFGSTFTKLTAIDTVQGAVAGTARAFTTIDTDVMTGFNHAMEQLENAIGAFHYDQLLCCSSAAGGLKMIAVGLVPDLTAKAAKMAASSAGAKVMKTYSFELSEKELTEIAAVNPDLVLLCGGTDGGNREVILTNARLLAAVDGNFSIIAAGNKSVDAELETIFKTAGKTFVITENVMPTFNQLNIEPARQAIRELFIRNIVAAKGLSKMQALCANAIIPTPLAVMTACELLSKGTRSRAGIGELVCIDLGGATTDVYSMAKGKPASGHVIPKGLPEPFSKRTVEGDLGMRYSLAALADALNMSDFSEETAIPQARIEAWIARCTAMPDIIAAPESEELFIEESLAKKAVELAVERHCGILESAYTPLGEILSITGKDLTEIPSLIGIGGAIINSKEPHKILEGALYSARKTGFMKPKAPRFYLDKTYIFAAMGLLSAIDEELALRILTDNLKPI
ncbi:MAG: glutamate mutase L [Prevotellaceae bacterium]|jgi:uncharacterized protein (TIGR01319 family)|nr:glutamate mutase L [Prevotellaceae bacterium]